MLLYIQESKDKNAVDDATAEVDEYLCNVVNNKRTVDAAMTFGHKLDLERKAGIEQGAHDATIIDIGKSAVMLKKSNVNRVDASVLLNEQYPDYPDVIIAKLDEIYL